MLCNSKSDLAFSSDDLRGNDEGVPSLSLSGVCNQQSDWWIISTIRSPCRLHESTVMQWFTAGRHTSPGLHIGNMIMARHISTDFLRSTKAKKIPCRSVLLPCASTPCLLVIVNGLGLNKLSERQREKEDGRWLEKNGVFITAVCPSIQPQTVATSKPTTRT